MNVNQYQIMLVIAQAESQEIKEKFILEFKRFATTAKGLQRYLKLIKDKKKEKEFPASSFTIMKQIVLQNEESFFYRKKITTK